MRDQVARADRETTDPYARQSVISAAAELLDDAGLVEESDALLEPELKRSHSPYYFMLGLAANAKKRGDKAWRSTGEKRPTPPPTAPPPACSGACVTSTR